MPWAFHAKSILRYSVILFWRLFAAARLSGLTFSSPMKTRVTPARTVTIETTRGTVRADFLLTAGGAYLGDLFRPLAGYIMPVGTYIIATEPRADIAALIPGNEAVADLKQDIAIGRPRLASRVVSQKCLDALLPAIPELIGGSADATGSDAGAGLISAGNYGGRQVDYGTRAHGMAAAATGMALHGGIIPVIGTGFALSDSLRPALRLCAMMRQRVVYVLGDDSIGLGEAGPTRQPVEHLASLRAMPDLYVFRPADPMETAECWELALRRADGPSLLVLSRQALPAGRVDTAENRSARGGYVLA